MVIYNPTAGRPRRHLRAVEIFCRMLRSRGVDMTPMPTERPMDGARLAAAAAAGGAELVVAYGGDGTMNEVLQGVMGTDAALAIWPGGTANVLARDLGMPRSAVQMARRVLNGQTRRVAVGQAGDRYFLVMAGLGFDAEVVRNVPPDLKRRLGKGAFALTALGSMRNYVPQPFRLRLDGEEVSGTFAVIANSPRYGGGFRFCPDARLEDPFLQVCVFQVDRVSGFLPYLLPALSGWHVHLPGVTVRRVQTIAADPASGPVPVQLDGEAVGHLPMGFRVVPAALDVLV